MKIIVTGSLGNISKPLAQELLQQGHAVTVISSKPEKQKEIEALGATPAIGSLEDVPFLITTFTGADAVYCMIPPNYKAPDPVAYYRATGDNYAQAIRQSGIKRVVHLSSYGAHLESGTGIITGSHQVERALNEIQGIGLTHMRPAYFNYNLYNFTDMIRSAGVMVANYGGDDKIVLVSPLDIAAAVADEITKAATGSNVRYVASEELTGNEIAQVLGRAIGKPDLKWNVITDEQMRSSLLGHGVPEILAAHLVEMFSSIHSGALTEDYDKNKPALGKVKLMDFAIEFAETFKQK